jgi:hypothetical protein
MVARSGAAVAIMLVLAACGDHDHAHDHPEAAPAAAALPPGVLEVPASAQQNLGLTWATASYRAVRGVLRVPGRLVAEPGARRVYAPALAGRIELLVRPYQPVSAGQALFRLHAPEWNRLRQELAAAVAASGQAAVRRTTGAELVAALERAVAVWQTRLATIERVGAEIGVRDAERAEAVARLAELAVELAEARRDLAEAEREQGGAAALRLRLLLAEAAQVTGLAPEALALVHDGVPAWAALDAITITAASAGVVTGEVAADGAWLPAQTPVLGVLDPRAVRFEGDGLHGDLPRLRDGQEARIVAADPGQGGELAARLVLAPEGDPLRRTLTLVARPEAAAELPAWARPGLGASLEITTAGGAGDELAIPVVATIRDGIDTVFFRRDRTHPDRVLRVVADLGANDGRWVAVLSGLKEGDEVVLDGIYQVMLAQRRDATPVGHVHADGTWHAGGH